MKFRYFPRQRNARKLEARGFALIVTLSLMILLTVVAVGLLTLSSISLRASTQHSDMQAARANARLALMLSIGQLQKFTGPDQRVTAPADQRTSGDGSQSSAALVNRPWTGVFTSWPATLTDRPDAKGQFLTWLVSGDASKVATDTAADTAAATDTLELVGAGTLGSAATGQVKVPVIKLAQRNGRTARLAWWVGDQGQKAAMSTPLPPTGAALATVRNNLQAAPRSATELAKIGATLPFASLAVDDARLPLLTSWKQAELLSTTPTAPRGLFHDLAPSSTGLLTNIREGGFRKDLSLQLERPASSAPRDPLYRVGSENGINLQELWSYYNLYKVISRSGTPTFTTGSGERMASRTPYLQVASGPASCQLDDNFYFKQPVIISYQLVLSFKAVKTVVGAATVNRLRVVADPIVTFWNPLDVPVSIPTASFMSIKYWQVPYDLYIGVNGAAPLRYPLAASLTGARTDAAGNMTTSGDSNFLSLRAGENQQLVFKPGEVIKVSQKGPPGSATKHNLPGSAGFFFEEGYALDVRDLLGNPIDLKADSDIITYEARPNNMTAGKTASSGNWLPGMTSNHSRHFSLTHHEYYIGADRDPSNGGNVSLGIGGMFIDWDFGNKRVGMSENRGVAFPGVAGTKPPGERLYADRFPEIFKPLTPADSRPLSASQLLTNKAPFMLMSYEAKTENGSASGTRFLSRFNPKALHVDFYDLSPAERDILPYEFRAEPLVSWKNRSIEVSANGQAYYGGGMSAEFGSNFVTTHSIPREPIVSLAAFQHSFANGFEMTRPKYGYGTLNAREPMLPQIAHAIGNSMAPPMMSADRTEGSISGGRAMADHSYLANRELWDAWFLSGIAPQSSNSHPTTVNQKNIATGFFEGTRSLPVVRYQRDLDGKKPGDVVNSLFTGSTSSAAGIRDVASHLRVDGLFNVNSTSVEAWKAMLGSLKGRQIVVRNAAGAESIVTNGETPVANLAAPENIIAKGTGSVDVKEADQWVGRRSLSDDEIDSLARAVVKEVRKRGPFLSLADFVNRRVGTDRELARAGAIQNALDSDEVAINSAYNSGRSVSTSTANRFAFKEAEEGPLAYGSPGVVKQADILTPIAPVLSARSDSFIIRAYGESVDANGKVTARAWCEAVVERNRNFVDLSDKAETAINNLTREANRVLGRSYQLVSFRWLNSAEV